MCQQQETLPAGVTAAPFACRRGALTLRGVEYRPAGHGALPIAIVCHGFMQNLDTVRHYARALAGAGWLAYCFDFSGGCAEGCRSDGATTDMSALTEVEDLQAVLAWAASRPYAGQRPCAAHGLQHGRVRLGADGGEARGPCAEARAVLPGAVHPGRRARRADDVRPL